MRHGLSKANAKNIIACNFDMDNINEGLTKEGKLQAQTSALDALNRKLLHKGTIIYSSDFQRCKETAEITAEVIGATMVRFTHLLRERNFGTLNKKTDDHYQLVWDEDLTNPNSSVFNSQSTNSVHQQNLTMFEEIEGRYFQKQILLVTHGDRLNIMMTIFAHTKPNFHRTQPNPWLQSEIREFKVF